MKIEKLVLGDLQENCYILSQNGKTIIIDPGDEAQKILNVVSSLNVVGIFITHFHFDHIGALKELEEYFGFNANDFEILKQFGGEVIKTPGHTMDSLSFWFPSIKSIFVGDFVFYKGIGRTDLGGNEISMKLSIKFLLTHFEDDTILYPGHGKSTIIKEERFFLEQYLLF